MKADGACSSTVTNTFPTDPPVDPGAGVKRSTNLFFVKEVMLHIK